MAVKEVDSIKLADDPEYVEANAKLVDLQVELSRLDTEVARVQDNRAERTKITLRMAAQRLIDGDERDQSPEDEEAEERQLGSLMRSRTEYRVAVEMQHKTVSEALGRASQRICEGLWPQWASIVKRKAAALIALAEVAEQEREFTDRLREAGVQFVGHLRPMPFRHGVDGRTLRDPGEMLARWFFDGIEHGLLAKSDVPADLRKSWGIG